VPRSYVTLAEHPTDMVRLACTKCERRGQFRKATLLARFGPNYGLVSMRLDLAAGCPSIPAPSIHEHCGVFYPELAGADD
jgi:hypothetical protein